MRGGNPSGTTALGGGSGSDEGCGALAEAGAAAALAKAAASDAVDGGSTEYASYEGNASSAVVIARVLAALLRSGAPAAAARDARGASLAALLDLFGPGLSVPGGSAATVLIACGAVADALGRGGREGAENLKAALAAGAPGRLACAAAGMRSWAKSLPEALDWRSSEITLADREAAAEALLRAIAALAASNEGLAACLARRFFHDHAKEVISGGGKKKDDGDGAQPSWMKSPAEVLGAKEKAFRRALVSDEGEVNGDSRDRDEDTGEGAGAGASASTSASASMAEEEAAGSPGGNGEGAPIVLLALAKLMRSPLVRFSAGGAAAAAAAAVHALARSEDGAAALVRCGAPGELARLAETACAQSDAALAAALASAIARLAASKEGRAALVGAEAGPALLSLAEQPAVAGSAEATNAVSMALARGL